MAETGKLGQDGLAEGVTIAPTSRRRLTLNVVLNTAGTLVNAVSGFLVLPFLVSRLGTEGYGLWTLIVATTGYFLVLDFGVSGAVGRLVAGRRALGDVAEINTVITTTLIMLAGVAVMVSIATLIAPSLFVRLFDVPAAQQADVTVALLIVGFTTAATFPGLAFYGLLWGYERFDLHNAVEIPMLVIRTTLIFLVITTGSSLTTLAAIVSATTLVGLALRAAMAWRVEPALTVRPALFRRTVVSEVFVYGIWFSVMTFARSILPNIAPFVIGWGLGPVAVTTYTIPRMLAAYSTWVLVSATQVAAPRAAVYHFSDDAERQRALFTLGGRYAAALALFFFGGAVVLGEPLLALWQHGERPEEYRILVILMAGELLPMSQWVTYNTILSMGRHKRLAAFGLMEAAVVLAGSAVMALAHGLIGAAVVVALAGFTFRGLLQWLYACRLIGIRPLDYAGAVFLPITISALGPMVVAAAYADWVPLETWLGWLVAGAIYGVLYWAAVAPWLIDPPVRARIGGWLAARMRWAGSGIRS
jgi:O-antigen/teichoic acid export membrane protein